MEEVIACLMMDGSGVFRRELVGVGTGELLCDICGCGCWVWEEWVCREREEPSFHSSRANGTMEQWYS